MIAVKQRKKDNYGLKMLLYIIGLFLIMAAMFYKIGQNEPLAPSFAMAPVTDKPIYILKSYATAVTYQKNGLHQSQYSQKLEKFNSYIASIGYKTEYIQEDGVKSLSIGDILFIPDAIALSLDAKEQIKMFVKSGGNIFFNFTAGFSDAKGRYLGDGFVNEITGLKISKDKKFINFKESIFLTQRVLSPLNNTNSGILLDAPTYDLIPIYITPQSLKPDIFMTTYDQINPPLAKDKSSDFLQEESGAFWHGYYGEGKWFYINLPSYIFYDSSEQQNDYKQISHAIINFLSTDVIIQKYPYIDRSSIVFVSEDTEFKFENFKKFSDLARKYEIPVTAFIVSSLAEKKEHYDMMREISKNPFVEFGSHSHNHKKIVDTNESYIKQETSNTKTILDHFASSPIMGFRPPREELDATMKRNLSESGFKYILGKSQNYLYPRYSESENELLIIPRHGTDDYSYLINLDWDQDEIVTQIKKETEFVTGLDGIFSLSIHTHLFAYNSNIDIVEKYFQYLKRSPTLKPLNGRSIALRVAQNRNIYIDYSKTGDTIALNIENRSSIGVNDFHLKLFKNPNIKISSISSNQAKISEDSIINIKYLEPTSKITLFIELEN